ncbi:SanA/YdcF family protein [Flammeovirga pacifica]|uniref:DUF218 domain-containing protein n=1 Tax=Flammeovirga pacifica TaxID=915059 RepID=A0A1S1Z4X7_FLAPC|nr:ElyC/SanA/YdcF family protein [Flammeovirga pacifica]OHX68277.1 hypothetical protein NH26_18955 [Flammeovirga pacifica]
MRIKGKYIFLWSIVSGLLFTITAIYINQHVSEKSAPFILEHDNMSVSCKTGLLLGTSNYLQSGAPNPYFINRIQAATKLLREHDIEFVIVSGDNRTKNYNEPKKMRSALVKQGISKKNIVMDFAGFRTLDSVVRAKEVFGQDRFIIISQKFHIERAIYIARYHGIEAYGYAAEDVPFHKGYWVKYREILARVKMFLDLYVLKTKPKFLGKEEKVGE